MSYNPYQAAFNALTNEEAQRFYVRTAIAHTITTIDVAGAAGQSAYEAVQSFRRLYDAAIVPFTLMAIATVVEFFIKPEQPELPLEQPLLAGFQPIALLPAAKEVERVLITPHVTSDRVLTTAPVKVSGFTDEAILQLLTEESGFVEPIDGEDQAEPYSNHSYKELQALCKQRGISQKGSRETLVARLCKSDIYPDVTEWKVMGRTPAVTFNGRSIE